MTAKQDGAAPKPIGFNLPRSTIVSAEDPENFSFLINPAVLVDAIHSDPECMDLFIRAMVEKLAASEFLESLTDRAAPKVNAVYGDANCVEPMTKRGQVYLEVITAYACALGDIPDDYETREMRGFGKDADQLHEMLCDGRIADARDLLRAMLPDHDFISDAALLRLASDRAATRLL